MRPPDEVGVTPELLERVLELAGTEMVLAGGQALAFWAAHYGTPAPAIAVTEDVDLLGTRADVQRLARGLQGKAAFPRSSLTLLTGQVTKICQTVATSTLMCCPTSTETSRERA